MPNTAMELVSEWPTEEIYRFLIDGRLHAKEEGWLEYAKRETGCIQSLHQGFQFGLTNLSEPTVSPELIQGIHRQVFQHRAHVLSQIQYIPGDYRKTEVGYTIVKDTSRLAEYELCPVKSNDVKELQEKLFQLDGTLIGDSDLIRAHSDQQKQARQDMDIEKYEASYDLIKRTKQPHEPLTWEQLPDSMLVYCTSPEKISTLMQTTCDNFNRDIILCGEDSEKKLEVIANFVQSVERIHPFPDGNGRTSYVLLQRLLVQHDFPPTMLTNPNNIDSYCVKDFVNEIKAGIERTRNFDKDKGEFGYKTSILDQINALARGQNTLAAIDDFTSATHKFKKFQETLSKGKAIHETGPRSIPKDEVKNIYTLKLDDKEYPVGFKDTPEGRLSLAKRALAKAADFSLHDPWNAVTFLDDMQKKIKIDVNLPKENSIKDRILKQLERRLEKLPIEDTEHRIPLQQVLNIIKSKYQLSYELHNTKIGYKENTPTECNKLAWNILTVLNRRNLYSQPNVVIKFLSDMHNMGVDLQKPGPEGINLIDKLVNDIERAKIKLPDSHPDHAFLTNLQAEVQAGFISTTDEQMFSSDSTFDDKDEMSNTISP